MMVRTTESRRYGPNRGFPEGKRTSPRQSGGAGQSGGQVSQAVEGPAVASARTSVAPLRSPYQPALVETRRKPSDQVDDLGVRSDQSPPAIVFHRHQDLAG